MEGSALRKTGYGSGEGHAKSGVLVVGIGSWGIEAALHAVKYASRACGELRDSVYCVLIGDSSCSPAFFPAGNISAVDVPLPGDLTAEYINELREEMETWGWLPDGEELLSAGTGGRLISRMAFYNSEQRVRETLSRACVSMNMAQPVSGIEHRVFIIASSTDTYAGGMFLDTAALLSDITAGSAALNGILLNSPSPGPCDRYPQNLAAYDLFCEIEAFAGGSPFSARYPSGQVVERNDLFGNGIIYLLESVCGEKKRYTGSGELCGAAGLFCAVAASGALRAACNSEGRAAGNRAAWGSFGIASAILPFEAYRESACNQFVSSAIDRLLGQAGDGMRGHEAGDELLKSLNLSANGCYDIFCGRYPEYEADIKSVAEKAAQKADAAAVSGSAEELRSAADDIVAHYSAGGIDRFAYTLASRMGMRSVIELVKCRIILAQELEKIINGTGGGLRAAVGAAVALTERLALYNDKYAESLEKIEFYTAEDIRGIMSGGDDSPDIKERAAMIAGAVSFNYRQAVYREMLVAAKNFVAGYMRIISGLCSGRIYPLLNELERTVADHGAAAIPRCDLPCVVNDVTWTGDGKFFSLGAFLPDVMSIEHPAGQDAWLPDGYLERGCSVSAADAAGMIKKKFFDLANSALDNDKLKAAINNMTGLNLAASDGEIHEKLGLMSTPLVRLSGDASRPGDEYKVLLTGDIARDVYPETGGEMTFNSVIAVPELCRPWESIAVSVRAGFQLSSVESIEAMADEYLLCGNTSMFHIFEGADAWPGQPGKTYHAEPGRLWSGLQLLGALHEQEGKYVFDEELHPFILEIEARESYKKTVMDMEESFRAAGGIESADDSLLAAAAVTLGMMARTTSGGMTFRKEYSSSVSELAALPGRDAGSLPEPPVFSGEDDLAEYIGSSRNMREFIRCSVYEVMRRTKGNLNAGAYIMLPVKLVQQYALPAFDNTSSFAEYCGTRESAEFFSGLNLCLEKRLSAYIENKFMHGNISARGAASGISLFLKAIEEKMPLTVIMNTGKRFGVL